MKIAEIPHIKRNCLHLAERYDLRQTKSWSSGERRGDPVWNQKRTFGSCPECIFFIFEDGIFEQLSEIDRFSWVNDFYCFVFWQTPDLRASSALPEMILFLYELTAVPVMFQSLEPRSLWNWRWTRYRSRVCDTWTFVNENWCLVAGVWVQGVSTPYESVIWFLEKKHNKKIYVLWESLSTNRYWIDIHIKGHKFEMLHQVLWTSNSTLTGSEEAAAQPVRSATALVPYSTAVEKEMPGWVVMKLLKVINEGLWIVLNNFMKAS